MSVAASCFASRREAVFVAVETYNRAHPEARLPRPAARLLAVMFAAEDVCCVSQQELMAEGFGDTLPGCCVPWLRQASCQSRRAPRVSRTPTACCFRWRPGHEPPREAIRSRPCRAAGPQRQGPHHGLRPRLGRPTPPARPTPRPDHPRLPGGPGGAAVGLPQRRGRGAASRHTRRSPPRPSAAAIPSTRR